MPGMAETSGIAGDSAYSASTLYYGTSGKSLWELAAEIVIMARTVKLAVDSRWPDRVVSGGVRSALSLSFSA